MKLRTTSGERLRIGILTLTILVAGIVGWWGIGEASLVLLIVLCLGLLLFMQMEVAGLLKEQQRHELLYDFRQIEALFSLFFALKPELPLPDTRDWAASPDFLKKLAELVLTHKAEMIAEAGSGVSTLIIAYCLKRLGRGKVISLEHDEKFAKVTSEMIRVHGLTAFADVVYCPLVKVEIGKETFMWYAMDKVRFDKPIDILVVDGPPVTGQPFPRYPALPLLFASLAKDAYILLDDGRRADETRTNARWSAEFAPIASEFLPVEKGAFLLRKSESGELIYGSQVTTFL